MIDIRRYFSPVIVRAMIYAASLALLTSAVMQLPAESFHEGSIVEWLQFAFLFLSAGAFAFTGFKDKTIREFSFTIALFLIMACIRECDRCFDRLLFEDSWKVGVTIVFIPTAILVIKKAETITESAINIINYNCFGMLLSGFLVLLFSRLFGHNDYWSHIMHTGDQKTILRIIEEITELLSYFLILTGSIEYTIQIINPCTPRQKETSP